jgi:prepilin-type N-terminal cleavage/methylation domain-containing protein
MTRRSAFTLIELLVALSLFAVILPLCGWLVYILLHAQSASGNAIADTLTRSRFSRTFRGDAHAAIRTKVDHSGTGSRVVFEVDSSTSIAYAAKPGDVVTRTIQTGGATKRRDAFRFTGTEIHFEEPAQGTIAAVQSSLRPQASPGSHAAAGAGTVRIEAVVGRDRRYLTAPPAKQKRASEP